ncbi:MAG: T9SS type A sorting domain-containing protein [Bacteroidetes bacterium]|nr:T9SS type A sorting domain-containing protein [Bacteroidota bacterium]
MKKILLSVLTLSLALAGSANAQAQVVVGHLNAIAGYDDFMDGSQYIVGNNDYSHPVIVGTDTTYRGMYWTEAAGTINGFKAAKTRTGTAIDYLITQTEGAYEPFLMVFGENKTAVKFTMDLSSNAVVSFSVKNKGAKTVRFQVQMQDINGTTLAYNPAVIGDEAAFYNHNIGYVQGDNAALAPGDIKDFSFDFKTAVVGCLGNVVGGQGACTTAFDYTKVTGVTFTVVDDANTGALAGTGIATCGSYCPLAITDYPIMISNFKIGKQSSLSVSTVKQVGSYSVFPNPTSDFANVTLQLNEVSAVNISVVDMFGRTVKQVVNGNFSSVNEMVNVSDLSQGVYTVNYMVDGATAKSTLLMVK